ncbi:hypothetical protein E1293_03645 [Actinomadura darangshiensis]|uniref:DUF3558 domain-containing protein n=1 Tax=Actinomadura darangshiensis TaxID=705336 RepID=A0A4R5BWU6_9ACTN|nr:hypothetical protein [Actinomadura darangshiensis]TDD90143.1 hypothetical protein E1293_03645 [Actinomadura darangshiensis]
MSDPEPAGPPLRTGRRRLALAGAAAVVVLVVTVAVVASRGSGDPGGISDGPLIAAPAGAEQVPAGRIVKKIPHNCGVSDGTAARLAPGSDPDPEKGGVFREGGAGDCSWYSLDDGKAKCGWCFGDDYRNERVLDVDISLATGIQQSPISEAMQMVGMTGPGSTGRSGPPKIVEGLGEEAVVRYSAEQETEGANLAFRVGNAVVSVRYTGWDAVRGRERTISEKTAVDGAFAAAAETAKSMGAAARPVLSTGMHPATPALGRVPRPCDAVPGATVDKVARGAYRRRGASTLMAIVNQAGLSVDSCTWKARTSRYSNEGRSRALTVSLAVADEDVPGYGAFTATRQYQAVYRNLREKKSITLDDFAELTPLTGPGERAFAVTEVGSGSSGDAGLVLFQKRNVLVEVAYEGADKELDLRGRQLIDSAYTVAVAVERSLRS